MSKEGKLHFFIIDDDTDLVALYQTLLEDKGYIVTTATSSEQALDQIVDSKPDCIICDLMLPKISGLDLFQRIHRSDKIVKKPKFIIISNKAYEFDRRQTLALGVDGYLTKPINIDTFVEDIFSLLSDEMIIQFWGVRGTLPVPGKKSVHYGGNTNCVTLRFGKQQFFIFDAGTGIKSLSDDLLKQKCFPLKAKIFISHPHWDHINGIPFFAPFYMNDNHFDIYGPNSADLNIEQIVSAQMSGVYFPVTIKEFSAHLSFHNISEGPFTVDDITMQAITLNHPGQCLGFRVSYKNKLFCYVTDNELYLKNSPSYNQFEVDRFIKFIKESDFLIIDATYSDDEYMKKINWGHSCVSRVIEIAHEANVKCVCLHHHDPDQTDKDIENKLSYAQQLLKKLNSKTICIVACEGEEIVI